MLHNMYVVICQQERDEQVMDEQFIDRHVVDDGPTSLEHRMQVLRTNMPNAALFMSLPDAVEFIDWVEGRAVYALPHASHCYGPHFIAEVYSAEGFFEERRNAK